jgi:hypothetical protein
MKKKEAKAEVDQSDQLHFERILRDKISSAIEKTSKRVIVRLHPYYMCRTKDGRFQVYYTMDMLPLISMVVYRHDDDRTKLSKCHAWDKVTKWLIDSGYRSISQISAEFDSTKTIKYWKFQIAKLDKPTIKLTPLRKMVLSVTPLLLVGSIAGMIYLIHKSKPAINDFTQAPLTTEPDPISSRKFE